MLLKFSHSTKVDLKELEKFYNAKRRKAAYCDRFVVVHNGASLEFALYFLDGIKEEEVIIDGIYLALESLVDLKLQFAVRIQRGDGSVDILQEMSVLAEFKGPGIRCAKPIANNIAELKSKKLLVDGGTHLSLGLEILIDDSYFDTGKELEREIASLDWKEIGFWPNIYDAMMGTEENTTYTDYTIVFEADKETTTPTKEIMEEGRKEFPCHKLLTSVRSPYFEARHRNSGTFAESAVPWPPKVIEEILHFMYKDKVSDQFHTVPLEVLADVAGMLELEKLVALCEKRLIEKLDEENSWEYLRIAVKHEMGILQDRALCLISEDGALWEKLVDEELNKELRKEVAEFALKKRRAQLLVI